MNKQIEKLRKELSIIKCLGFEEIKPLLWCRRENLGVLYFDYRDNIIRKSYAVDFNGNSIDKKFFENYTLFKMRVNKE